MVTFPQKIFERESVSSSTRVSGKKLVDEESSSSSSSDSDSSSDSEEEDNALKDAVKTKVSFPRHDPISFENRTMKVKIRTEKHFPQEQDKARAPYSLSSAESSVKQKGINQASDNKLLKPDMAKYATKQRPVEAPFTNISLEIKLAGRQRPNEVATKQGEASPLEETSPKWSTTPSRPQQSIAQNPTLLEQEKNAAVEMQATESQGKDGAVQQDKTLNDRTSVVETMKEEIIPEVGIQTEQQSTPPGIAFIFCSALVCGGCGLHPEYTSCTLVIEHILHASRIYLSKPFYFDGFFKFHLLRLIFLFPYLALCY